MAPPTYEGNGGIAEVENNSSLNVPYPTTLAGGNYAEDFEVGSG